MSAPADATQTVVVTAVPRGYAAAGVVEIGALVSPRLSNPARAEAVLGDFADWDGWPEKVVSWQVSFDGAPWTTADLVSQRDQGRLWHEIFGPSTRVASFDGSPGPARTALGYTFATLADGIAEAYTVSNLSTSQLGTAARSLLPPQAQAAPTDDMAQALRQFLGFWEPVGDADPTRGELDPDFHERLTLLSDHPRLLEALGLVVRLRVAPPVTSAVTNVRVRLVWTPSTAIQTVQVNPPTAVVSSNGRFAPALRVDDGAHDDRLRLALGDADRFSVHSVDVDATTAQVVSVVRGRLSSADPVTAPSARGGGLTLAWRGRMQSLQSRLDNGRTAALAARSNPAAPPMLYAEDLLVGHHLQVGVVDEAASGQPLRWFGLGHRATTYRTTSASLDVVDEAPVSMTARRRDPAQATTLLVSDVVARWDGWSLAVPHPARQLLQSDPEHPGVEHDPGSPGPQFGSLGFDVKRPTVAADGTDARLPALRYGRRYSFRGRAVDVTGGAPAWDGAPATAPVRYQRWEAAASPLVVPPPALTSTEDAFRLVVRSDPAAGVGPGPASTRVLVPPKVSIALGLLHGVFDRADGTPEPARHGLMVGLDTSEPPTQTSEPSDGFPARVRVDWLPDPMTTDVHVDVDGLQPQEVSFVPGADLLGTAALGAWFGVGLRLVGLAPGATSTTGVNVNTTDRRRVDVGLRPGARARVEVRSIPREARILQHGVLDLRPGNVTSKRAALARGDIPTVAPNRVVELVHAVKQPLRAPAVGAAVAQRTAGQKDPVVAATVSAHDETSGRLTLTAAWDEYVDAGKSVRGRGWSAPSRVRYDRTALLDADLAPVETPAKAPVQPMRDHEYSQPLVLPDLRRRDVTLSVSATSRFVEEFRQPLTASFPRVPAVDGPRYLVLPADVDLESVVLTEPVAPPPDPLPDPPPPPPIPRRLAPGTDYEVAEHPTTGRRTLRLAPSVTTTPDVSGVRGRVVAVGATREVVVPSAVRPAPPELVHALPAWESDDGDVVDGVAIASRGPGRLRLWLERPWYSSGVGEQLAVVVDHDRTSGPDFDADDGRLSQVVTLYGLDPVLRPESASLARTAPVSSGTKVGNLVVAEELGFDGQLRATVAAHDVRYHAGRDLYVTEVAFPPKPAGTFVRLAVARYQQHVADGVPHLSRIVTLDPVQLLPSRTVRIRNRGSSLEARVGGLAHGGEDLDHRPRVRLSLQKRVRTDAGPDLGWDTLASAVVTAKSDGTYPPVSVPRGGVPARGHRLLVEELEQWLLPGNAASPAYTKKPASAKAAVDDLSGERITWVATTPLPTN